MTKSSNAGKCPKTLSMLVCDEIAKFTMGCRNAGTTLHLRSRRACYPLPIGQGRQIRGLREDKIAHGPGIVPKTFYAASEVEARLLSSTHRSRSRTS